jgi:uncharacterized protein YecT (DUF1311 family)
MTLPALSCVRERHFKRKVIDFMKLLLPSLLVLAAIGQPAIGQTAGAAAQDSGQADPAWLAKCMEENGSTLGMAKCMVDHRTALQEQQQTLLKRIRGKLAGQGPEGTDYKAAAASFAEAQKHWEAFIAADCDIVGSVFGYGTAQGLAGEDCTINHYRARNDQLRELDANYLTPGG